MRVGDVRPLGLVAGLCCVLATGCTFDRSSLEERFDCVTSAECPADSQCEDGSCVSVDGLDRDLAEDEADIDESDIDESDSITSDVDESDSIAFDSGENDTGPDTREDPIDNDDTGAIAEVGDLGNPDCPGAENACGGCRTLNRTPGGLCAAECGSGTWVCIDDEAVGCEPDDGTINSCGTCVTLDDEPGTACSPCADYQCGDDGETVVCPENANECGGCGELQGRSPGFVCGTCGDGLYVCNDDLTAVECDGATEPNDCGGCEGLREVVGDECSADCGSGSWACATENVVICDPTEGTINACGGCEPLDGTLGEQCGDCGITDCAEDRESIVCVDPDLNACDGCGALIGTPDDACGLCNDGSLVCNEERDGFDCSGASGLNACGGCGELDDVPLTPCGVCLDGEWTCNEDGSAVTCESATPPNECGGCGVLVGEIDDVCGDCDDGSLQCNDANTALECLGASDLNACPGCGVLDGEPGTGCGICDSGTWTCNPEGSAVTCEDEGETNECGGCAALPGAEDEVCTCGGAGDAVWACETADTMSCDDSNEIASRAEDLGTITDVELVVTSSYVDYSEDVDFFKVGVTDTAGDRLNPLMFLVLDSALDGSVFFDACVYYRYTDDGDIRARNYECTRGNCVAYDWSTDTVWDLTDTDGDCDAYDEFDASEDLYGCCDTNSFITGEFLAYLPIISDIDASGTGQSGDLYGSIQTLTDTPACVPYDIYLDPALDD